MNAWQVCKQLKSLLEAETWDDGDQDVVFGKVLVSAAPTDDASDSLIFPFCLVVPLGGRVDDQHEDLVEQDFQVRVVTRVIGDPWGETVLIGGPRSGGQGGSQGRGLMELEEKVYDAIVALDQTNGVALRLDVTEPVEVTLDETHGYIASKAYRLTAWTTIDRGYPAPSRFTATQSFGSVILAWTLPPSRYDRTAIIVRRASGSTAPASVTAGTGITVGATDTTVTDSPGGGTWSYSVFMSYDDLLTGTADRWSSAATVTGEAVATDPNSILGAKCVGWWDGSDSDVITSAAAGISLWEDKSATGDDLSQAVDAQKPNVAAAAFNGLDAILFDDSVSYESLAGEITSITAAPFHLFVVAALDAAVDAIVARLRWNTAQYWHMEMLGNTSWKVVWESSVGPQQVGGSVINAISSGVAALLQGYEQSSSARSRAVDGTSVDGTGTSAPTGTTLTLQVGTSASGQAMSGHVMEIVLVDESSGAITAVQLAALETYLERWGMTIP